MQAQSALQLYYWKVTFASGKVLSQFDEKGNEIIIKEICPKDCILTNPVTGEQSVDKTGRVFAKFEEAYGRAVSLSWVGFSKELAEAIMNKQPGVRIAGGKEIKPITIECPLGYYIGLPYKLSAVKFGVNYTSEGTSLVPIDILVSKIFVTLVPYDKTMETIHNAIDVVYE